MDLPILGVDNAVSVPDIICDAEPHFFKFWDAEDVINPFLVDPTHNRTKTSLLVGGIGYCVIMFKYPDVSFYCVYDNLFIVHMVVLGEVVQVYPGKVYFLVLIYLLVHHNGDSVL